MSRNFFFIIIIAIFSISCSEKCFDNEPFIIGAQDNKHKTQGISIGEFALFQNMTDSNYNNWQSLSSLTLAQNKNYEFNLEKNLELPALLENINTSLL